MAEHLQKLISDWKSTKNEESPSYKDLFKEKLHNHPYYLKYSLDKYRPNLFMIHPTEGSDLADPVVLESNGIILDTTTFEIIAYGMPTMDTIEHGTDPSSVSDDFKAEAAEDGTVLRVFFNVSEWVVSTNRRIDASRVRWCSEKSFYDLLREAAATECGGTLDIDLTTLFDLHLSKDSVHSFVVLHPENQLVIGHDKPSLVYVSCRNRTTMEELKPQSLPFARLSEILTKDEASRLFKGENIRDFLRTKRGIIWSDWSDPKLVRRHKLDFPGFTLAHDLRRNYPTMDLSYLASQDDEERVLFRTFYPMYTSMFDILDGAITAFSQDVFKVYRESYIKKKFLVDPSDDIFMALRAVHYRYRQTSQPIQVNTVLDVMQSLPPYYLSHMLSKGRVNMENIVKKEKPQEPVTT